MSKLWIVPAIFTISALDLISIFPPAQARPVAYGMCEAARARGITDSTFCTERHAEPPPEMENPIISADSVDAVFPPETENPVDTESDAEPPPEMENLALPTNRAFPADDDYDDVEETEELEIISPSGKKKRAVVPKPAVPGCLYPYAGNCVLDEMDHQTDKVLRAR